MRYSLIFFIIKKEEFKLKKCVSIVLSLVMLCTALLVPNAKVSAASTFNYTEALQKAIYFYECQQAGPLPEWNRVEWRGDSTMNDYVTGGWYDAGDHVKFNLPMSYSASMLGWALYEYGNGIEASGQKEYLERNLKFALDYLVACDKGTEVVAQVGDGDADHKWWGPVEVIELEMDRPYYTTKASCITGGMAAALAIGSIVLKDENYLKHAKSLFNLADSVKSDATYNFADAFYKSWSGFYDELTWAATWLYLATNDKAYLDKAESYVSKLGTEDQSTELKYTWGHCWDDVHFGALLMLAKVTDKPEYHQFMQKHLDWWTVGTNGKRIQYTPGGLAWLDQWGSLRYATTAAFLASVYADFITDDKLKTRYNDFAKRQIDYALGDNPDKRSYVIGFGNNPPQHPHHRTSHGSWSDQMTTPENHRHILYGALVGGPGRDDKYKDDIKEYTYSEVATDYNAGFVGILCKMTSIYGGTPEAGFPKKETKDDEFYVEACINQAGQNYTEIKALLTNHSAWPARTIKDFKYRYYVDLTEVFAAGATENDIKVTIGYDEHKNAKISQLKKLSGNIYYTEIAYPEGTPIAPMGQEQNSAELQFRIAAPEGTNYWDPSNDYSYTGLKKQDVVKTKNIPVYDGTKLLYGTPLGDPDPDPGEGPGNEVNLGDLNGDKKINSTDLLLLKKYILGLIGDDEINKDAADVNKDGKINSTDLLLLKQYILGLNTSF